MLRGVYNIIAIGRSSLLLMQHPRSSWCVPFCMAVGPWNKCTRKYWYNAGSGAPSGNLFMVLQNPPRAVANNATQNVSFPEVDATHRISPPADQRPPSLEKYKRLETLPCESRRSLYWSKCSAHTTTGRPLISRGAVRQFPSTFFKFFI